MYIIIYLNWMPLIGFMNFGQMRNIKSKKHQEVD